MKFRGQDCEIQLRKWDKILQVSTKKFNNTVVETQLREKELGRVTKEFRRMHKERNDAVDQWKEALSYIKNKDSGVKAAAEVIRVITIISVTSNDI